MNVDDSTKRIAFAAAVFAGVAYFSVSLIRDAFKSRSDYHHDEFNDVRRKRTRSFTDLRHGKESASSQTDLTLPIGTRAKTSALHSIPPELWTPWAKSIHDRIRDLNVRLVSQTPAASPSAWNKHPNAIQVMPPRPLTPSRPSSGSNRSTGLSDDRRLEPHLLSVASRAGAGSRNSSSQQSYMSRSSDNLMFTDSDDELMQSAEDVRCISSNSLTGIRKHVLAIPNMTEIKMYEKTLDKLSKKTNNNLSQQEVSVLSMLLLAHDEDVLCRTASVIAAATAFSINVDPLIDSGCTIALTDLLHHNSTTVQVAVTQAIANLAFSERGQEIMRETIPILVKKVNSSKVYLQLDWSLMALSNFAMKDMNHELMIDCLPQLMHLLSSSNPNIRIKSLKLLVNLSLNPDMVPFILGAKAPANLYHLISEKTDGEVLIRLITFLANLIDTVASLDIRGEDLPVRNKAASFETLFAAIYGFDVEALFVQKIKELYQISDPDLNHHLDRIMKRYLFKSIDASAAS